MASHYEQHWTAKRYAEGRPYFHPGVLAIVRALRGPEPFSRTLDLACGTGQSSRAAQALSDRVFGVDRSGAMLLQAGEVPGLLRVQGLAEALPFARDQFDLVTVALALHWMESDRALTQIRRVLQPGGWLVVYTNAFTGSIAGDATFQEWVRGEYLKAFPTPVRRRIRLAAAEDAPPGFSFVAHEAFKRAFEMDGPTFVRYLTSQSNVSERVGREGLDPNTVTTDLEAQVSPWFQDGKRPIEFNGWVTILERTEGDGESSAGSTADLGEGTDLGT